MVTGVLQVHLSPVINILKQYLEEFLKETFAGIPRINLKRGFQRNPSKNSWTKPCRMCKETLGVIFEAGMCEIPNGNLGGISETTFKIILKELLMKFLKELLKNTKRNDDGLLSIRILKKSEQLLKNSFCRISRAIFG